MFTGVIEEVGAVMTMKKLARACEITVEAVKITETLKPGDSVCTNGVCLTATRVGGRAFTADVMNETLSRSALGGLAPGSRVNLERAMPADGRFGGHIVSGHIDGTGWITAIWKDGIALRYAIRTVPGIMRYIVEKGSIAVDGISLTVAAVQADRFSVSVIPHTANETTLVQRVVGSAVNLENDMIAKYIEKLI